MHILLRKKYYIFFNINNKIFLIYIILTDLIQDMRSDKVSIIKNAFPSTVNQFPSNGSQINNYYINLTHNLNINNFDDFQIPKYTLNANLNNLNIDNQNSNENLVNSALLNSFHNVRNFISLLQMQETYKQYQELLSNKNVFQKSEKNLKKTSKMTGIKRNRTEKKIDNNEIKNIHDKNIKIIIKEKNGETSKNKNLKIILDKREKIKNKNKIIKTKDNNNTNYMSPLESKIEINLKKAYKNKENDLIISEKENKNEMNNRKKKRNRYKELLKDTILENLDRTKNDISIIITNSESANTPNKKGRPKNTKNMKRKKNLSNSSNNINKTKKLKNLKKHFTYKKKIKKNNIYYQPTECIFHGDNYENTNSASDFMKYNYNYLEEIKQPKKKINEAEKQVINSIPEIICNNNYLKNKNNLSDLKPLWLRSKFKGNDSDLNEKINLIKNKIKDGKDDINEEECLERLMENTSIYKVN